MDGNIDAVDFRELRAVFQLSSARALGLMLHEVGINVDCLPMLDVRQPGATDIRDGRWHKIKVKLRSAPGLPRLKLRTRDGYMGLRR